MTAQPGRDMLVRIGDGADPEVFSAVAGLRLRTISLNARTIDITQADSAAGWRELLGGAGVKTCAVSGSGVFVNAGADSLVRTAFFEQTLANCQLLIPGLGQLSGAFQIVALDYAGRHDDAVTWSMALASAGEIRFEPLP